MVAEVHRLHTSPPIAHYLRLGHTGHRQLENLHAAGRFGVARVVADAAHVSEQVELLDVLRSARNELVLDPRVAELSTPGGYTSTVTGLPWANPNRPFAPGDFGQRQIRDLVVRIAGFAVSNKFDVVLAPTHLLEGPNDPWLAIDVAACGELRRSLDELGGKSIAIDYPLMINYRSFLDGAVRGALIGQLGARDLPFDNLWLRIANFGSDKSAAGIRKYIDAARTFHELGKPLVADGVGGLPALGIAAFGATGGFCHGVAEKERFYPNYWWKSRGSSGGGTLRRVYFPSIDSYFNEAQSRVLLGTRGAKPLLACRDPSCCAGGWEDMLANPKTHYLTQTTRRVTDLGRVPELRRADHFLSQHLEPADRIARQVARLKVADEQVVKKLVDRSRRIDDLRQVLEGLRETSHNLTRSDVPAKRATG